MILTLADVREVTLLCLLDLSAAFDCVDHILLQRQEVVFSMKNTALARSWQINAGLVPLSPT